MPEIHNYEPECRECGYFVSKCRCAAIWRARAERYRTALRGVLRIAIDPDVRERVRKALNDG